MHRRLAKRDRKQQLYGMSRPSRGDIHLQECDMQCLRYAAVAGKMACMTIASELLLLNGPGVVRKMNDPRVGNVADLRFGVFWLCLSLRWFLP